MSAHSAGPWVAEKIAHNECIQWVISSRANPFESYTIATYDLRRSPTRLASEPETDANARLMAAAPELYAAAKALVAEIFIDEDTEQDDPLITMRYIRQLRDAIAKAEGR